MYFKSGNKIKSAIKFFRTRDDKDTNTEPWEDSRMSTSGVSGVTLHLSNYSTQLQEKQQENRTAATAVDSTLMSTLQTDYVNISSEAYDKSQSMMAGNFVGGSSTDSTYINAQLSMKKCLGLPPSKASSRKPLMSTCRFMRPTNMMQFGC